MSFKRASDGRWVATLDLPSSNGERRRKTLTARTKAEVDRKLLQARIELERAGDLATASQTLETWLNYWLRSIAPKRVRPNTLADYRSRMTNHVIPIIGKVRLDKLSPTSIRRVHDTMLSKGLSSTYVRNTHRPLAKALEDAVREGRVSRNVARLVDVPSPSRLALEPLDLDEAIAVIRLAADALQQENYDPTPVLWATYLLTANRRGELLGLEWDRVHFGDDSYIDLSWQMQRVKDIETAPVDYEYRQVAGKLYLTRPKTNAGWRVVPLVEPLRTLLADHRRRSGDNPHGLVFVTPHGRPVEPTRASATWAEWRATVTTKTTRLHDLRHTTVDLLYEAGVPEDIIQEVVGHSTRTMTRAYKARGNRARLTAAMESLSDLVSPARDELPAP